MNRHDVVKLWISRTDLRNSGFDHQSEVPRIVRYLRDGSEKLYGAGVVTDVTEFEGEVTVTLRVEASITKNAKLNSISTKRLHDSEVSDELISLLRDLTKVSWRYGSDNYGIKVDISTWKIHSTKNGISFRELRSPYLRTSNGEVIIEAKGSIVPICSVVNEREPLYQETIRRVNTIIKMAINGLVLCVQDARQRINSAEAVGSAKTTPYNSSAAYNSAGSYGTGSYTNGQQQRRVIQTPGTVSPKMHPVPPPQLQTTIQPAPRAAVKRPASDPILLADVVSPRGPPLGSPRAKSLNTERDALDLQLKKFGFIEHPVKADGNCLFRSIAWHLHGDDSRHREVRSLIVKHLKNNPDQYSPFVDEEYKVYLKDMSRQDTWGDHVTLQAAADSCGLLFHVITLSEKCHQIRPRRPASGDQEPLWLSFCATPHAEHYNPITRPKNKKLISS